MKIAILTDTHWGARSDHLLFLDYSKKFLDEVFFPVIDKNEIKCVVHLGDLVDRRKYINYLVATRLRQDFLQPCFDRNLDVAILVGNHDVYYKSTNNINALQELVKGPFPDFKVFTRPTEITIDKSKILLLPWINDENRKESLKAIKETKAQICFGHLELNGFEMNRGYVIHEGDDPKSFDKFDIVLTGHYHHKSTNGTVFYLGAPIQFSWSDWDDPRGFHIFDTDTRDLTFIENPFIIFRKIFYDDRGKTIDQVVNTFDFDTYKDSFIKLIVQEKANPYWFDLFVDKLEKVGIANLQIVDDHYNLDALEDEDIVSEAEDTLTIFHNFIGQLDEDVVNKPLLTNVINELYREALDLE